MCLLPNLPNLPNTSIWTIYVLTCELSEPPTRNVQQFELLMKVTFENVTPKLTIRNGCTYWQVIQVRQISWKNQETSIVHLL